MPDGEPLLRANFALTRGELALDVALELRASWTCLFGPSGGGKSTVLRVFAGLKAPEQGRIAFSAGPLLMDSGQRLSMPPHLRPVRLALQQAALFPGSVRRNVTFPMRGNLAAEKLQPLLEVLEIAPLVEQDARLLSGGERQRVSLCRAIAAACFGPTPAQLLLLDEPFTGMDRLRRARVLPALRTWLAGQGMPVLSVTHDVAEVFLLRAEVLRLEGGRITASGPAAEVLAAERQELLRSLAGAPDSLPVW